MERSGSLDGQGAGEVAGPIPNVTIWLVAAACGAGSYMDGGGSGVSVLSCACDRISGSAA
jgi:hypothetical protein